MADTHELKNVPIFSTGVWNGDSYSEADLDHMVAAFGQVGFQPPMKLGHDESQQLAKNDGMPAIGWVTNLRRAGALLYCDLRDLPKRVYEAIKRKNYNRVSAEIYWDYTCNGKKWPRVVKALSLLGADIPAVTSIASLEALYDGEGHEFKRYDVGLFPVASSSDSCPQMPIQGSAPVKAKSSVNYQEAEKGGVTRCGACEYFQGPVDPQGKEMFIGGCAIVIGEVASSWVCDLWEAREAFSTLSQERNYIIEQRKDKWVLLEKETGDVLGEHVSKAKAEAQERIIQASKVKVHNNPQQGEDRTEIKMNKLDAAVKERRYMEVEEIGGEFCVMKDGEKMKCFATEEEADAYQVSMMAQSSAEIKALQMKLESAEKLNKDLNDKIVSLDQMTTNLTAKFSEMEQRTTQAETEASQLKEQSRQAVNESWLAKMAHESNLKILPWERPFVSFILDSLTGGLVKTYADNGAELLPADAFKKLYEERKSGTILLEEISQGKSTETVGQGSKVVEFANFHDARREATKLAKTYMQEKGEKNFSKAFREVLKENPELKDAVAGLTVEGNRKGQDGTARMKQFFRE